MEKKIRLFLFVISVFAVWACVPVPVTVDTASPGYQGTYGYGYGDQPGYDEYGYGYDDYVDVPITYGEPVYYTPPISVTFAFDYFTYEVDNGFVDIVFWKGGHRHHRQPWYEQGRRISAHDIRSSRQHQRVRGPEFFEHRRKLEQQHRIAHPDTYYKLERRKQKEKLREQNERYRQEQERREQQDKMRLKEERLKQEQQLREQKYRLKEQKERYRQEQETQKRLFEQQQREPATMRQKDDRLRQKQELREQKYRLKEQEERNKQEMKKRAQEEKLRQKDERYRQQNEKREQKQIEKKMKERLKKDEKRKMDRDAVNHQIPPIY